MRKAKEEMSKLDFNSSSVEINHVLNAPPGLTIVSINNMYFEVDSQDNNSKIRLGKHLHYAPNGGKLCTYSSRQCMQKRMDGFGFCAKHILEDPTAPWKQCSYISGVTGKKCTSSIPMSDTQS